MIPPERSGDLVAAMEAVLDVYKRPDDPHNPVIGMDESPKQLSGEPHVPLPARPGYPAREDYEYVRNGTCCIFMAYEPLAGKRLVCVEERKTKLDWARFVQTISDAYPDADKIRLVMDNLNTHSPGSLYETFDPETAKTLLDRFEFIFTPKHGSWLNVAEIELNVLNGQCLNRRIPNIQTIRNETAALGKTPETTIMPRPTGNSLSTTPEPNSNDFIRHYMIDTTLVPNLNLMALKFYLAMLIDQI